MTKTAYLFAILAVSVSVAVSEELNAPVESVTKVSGLSFQENYPEVSKLRIDGNPPQVSFRTNSLGFISGTNGPAVVYVDLKGTNSFWYLNGRPHREDGPAVEKADGYRSWLLNDELHREDGPAVERTNGTREWFLNGKRHREDGPAIEWADGDRYWYLNDKLHRTDGPAIERANGNREWYLNGKCHREDGPAIEYANGYRAWYRDGIPTQVLKIMPNGTRVWYVGEFSRLSRFPILSSEYKDSGILYRLLHREDGPAIEWVDGSREWWVNGKLHREDGPAIEHANGDREWWVNGVKQHKFFRRSRSKN